MKKFDHNKLDEYREAMTKLGIHKAVFNLYNNTIQFSFYVFDKGNIFVTRYYLDTHKTIANSTDWEDFKKQVADYFLNGVD